MSHVEPCDAGTISLQHVFHAQLGDALAAVSHKRATDEQVHKARKQLKKARATLRLLRDALGKTVYARENAALRNAARPLSNVRDAGVLPEVLDQLVARNGRTGRELRLGPLRDALNRDLGRERRRMTHAKLSKLAATVRAAQRRSSRWRVVAGGWTELGSGLTRTYRKGRKACDGARSHTTEDLHELRKQLKYLRYEFQLLEPTSPKKVGKLQDRAQSLTDDLGEDHDLAVLEQRVQDGNGLSLDPEARDGILAMIRRRRRRMQKNALDCGQRLCRERPKHMRRRLRRYWRRWRDEGTRSARQ
jgi:CHAD domain-containing protein